MAGKLSEKKEAGFVAAAHAPIGTQVELNISDILETGPEHRARYNYGDVVALAEDIKTADLKQDVAVMAADEPGKYVLLEGARRIAAYKHLGRETIVAVVRKRQNVTVSEFSVEASQKGFSPFERLAGYRKIMADFEKFGERRGRPKLDNGGDGEKCGESATFFPGMRPGEKSRDYALRIVGLSKGSADQLEAVERDAIPRVRESVEMEAITLGCGYTISQLKQGEQLKRLREIEKTGEGNSRKLRNINNADREKGRLIRSGIDPDRTQDSLTESDVGENINPDDEYVVFYAGLHIHTKEIDIDTLSKLPIGRHLRGENMFCICCPNKVVHFAHKLLDAWKLKYQATIPLFPLADRPAPLAKLGNVNGFIVIGLWNPHPKGNWEDVTFPQFVSCANHMRDARQAVDSIFGTAAMGRFLDLTSPKGTPAVDGWTVYADKYGI